MKQNDRKFLTICAFAIALQIAPAYAQTNLDEEGTETFASDDKRIKSPKKENGGAMDIVNHVVFQERSSQMVTGTSSDREVIFSATIESEQMEISFILNGKEFLFVYTFATVKERKLISIQLIPESTEENWKTKDDDAALILLFKELKKDINKLEPLEGSVLSSLDFLLNMIPRDEPFETLDLRGPKKTGLAKPLADITNICAVRGRFREGSFDDSAGNVIKERRKVGNPASACLGRCGTNCFQLTQLKKRQYTAQCFAHDLCAGHFNEILGFGSNCRDEWVAASDDYINAPNCSLYVIGKWRLDFDWSCDGVETGTATLTLYSDHRFSAGGEGTWTLDGNTIIRTYSDTGTQYTGNIADSNLKTRGTMIDGDGGETGCFTDTYLTISIN